MLTFNHLHLLVHEELVNLGEVLQTRGAARDGGLGDWHPVLGHWSCEGECLEGCTVSVVRVFS